MKSPVMMELGVCSATDTAWAPWYVVNSDDKKRTRLNVITHLLGQIRYQPLEQRDVKLPKRQRAGDYQDPHLAVRQVPTVF